MRRVAHRTSLDRIGWAVAAGSAAVALGAALVGIGSGADLATVLLGALAAGAGSAVMIVVLGAPLWWLVARRVGHAPWAAGLLGVLLGAGSVGAVLGGGPGGLAMAGVAGFLGGLIALMMWLVAYRPG